MPVVFVRTCQICQTTGVDPEPVRAQRNTCVQYTYAHRSAQPKTTAHLQTHTNSTYGLILFPRLAGQDEGQLVGTHTHTYKLQGRSLQQWGTGTQPAL